VGENRRAGGVLAPEFVRRRVASAREPNLDFSSGAGAGANSVAQSLSRISANIGRHRDAAVAREGESSGRLAGMDPEFRPMEGDTIRARAHNAAAVRTYSARLEVDARRQLDEIYLANRDNPAAFAEAATALRNGFRDSRVFDEVAPDFEDMFDRAMIPYARESARGEIARSVDSARASAGEQVEARVISIERSASLAGLDDAADQILDAELGSLNELLVSYGPAGAFEFQGVSYDADPARSGALTATQMQTILTESRERTAAARVMGAFGRVDGAGAQSQFRASFVADIEAGEYESLDQATIDRTLTRMDSAIARGQAANDRARRTVLRSLETALADATRVADAGLSPGEAVYDAIESQALALGGDEGAALAIDARRGRLVFNATEQVRVMPLNDVNQWLMDERTRLAATEGATVLEAERLTAVEQTYREMTTRLASDPLSFANDAGLIDLQADTDVVTDFGAGTVPSWALNRVETAEAVAQHYGVAARYFTSAERTGIAAAIDAGEASALVSAQQIVSAFGADAPAALEELAPDQPLLAHIGGLLADNPQSRAAPDAQAGIDLAAVPGFQSRLDPARIDRARSVAALGDLATTMPHTAQIVRATADHIYEIRAARGGISEARFSEEIYNRAVNDALGAQYDARGRQYGGLATYRGRTIVAPSSIRADRFDDVIRDLGDIDTSALDPMYDSTGAAIPFTDLRRAHLSPAGDGRVFVIFGEPDSAGASSPVDATGEPYQLDLDIIADQIRAVHPDWVR